MAMQYGVPRQEVLSLPLPPTLRSALVAAGFRTVGDLERMGPVELSRAACISHEDALEALRVCSGRKVSSWEAMGAKSAVDLYDAQRSTRRIITFCSDLDRLLGGGVAVGQVTEFCGVPGVGKTQLGIQLAVDVQIPTAFGGLQGAAVYVDTEGSFMIDRVQDIARAAVKHINSMATRTKAGDPEAAPQARAFTLESILSNIFYFRIHDSTQQVALVHMLDAFLQQNTQVRLLVIDSITFHFRQDFKDMGQRSRVLTSMAQELMAAAERRGVAVVLLNQVTTRVTDEDKAKLVPALGESWGHAASTRVILQWKDGERYAFMYKSPSLPPGTAHYLVTHEGIRGARAGKQASKRPAEEGAAAGQQQGRPAPAALGGVGGRAR